MRKKFVYFGDLMGTGNLLVKSNLLTLLTDRIAVRRLLLNIYRFFVYVIISIYPSQVFIKNLI
jgi:hypothetical protein